MGWDVNTIITLEIISIPWNLHPIPLDNLHYKPLVHCHPLEGAVSPGVTPQKSFARCSSTCSMEYYRSDTSSYPVWGTPDPSTPSGGPFTPSSCATLSSYHIIPLIFPRIRYIFEWYYHHSMACGCPGLEGAVQGGST